MANVNLIQDVLIYSISDCNTKIGSSNMSFDILNKVSI